MFFNVVEFTFLKEQKTHKNWLDFSKDFCVRFSIAFMKFVKVTKIAIQKKKKRQNSLKKSNGPLKNKLKIRKTPKLKTKQPLGLMTAEKRKRAVFFDQKLKNFDFLI